MHDIAFAFDLHNTILHSNDAWIRAYLDLCGKAHREFVTEAVYRKKSRRVIADDLGIDYSSVCHRYSELVAPDVEMIELLRSLKPHYPLYLISSASEARVRSDLESWSGESFFDLILTKELFRKSDPREWRTLLEEQNLNLIIYIGNDPEEDVPSVSGVISLICGSFLQKLDRLDLLIRRGSVQP